MANRRQLAWLLPGACLALAACDNTAQTDTGPGGVTVRERQALDEAAEMLDTAGPKPAAQPSPEPVDQQRSG